jgi:hypothetical protein
MRTTRSHKMSALGKQPVRPIQIGLPADFVAIIDRIAAEQMLSRAAWMRRVLNNAVRYSRWDAELNKQR